MWPLRLVTALILAVPVAFSIVSGAFYNAIGYLIIPDTVLALAQTNPSEALNYLQTLTVFQLAVLLGGLILTGLVVRRLLYGYRDGRAFDFSPVILVVILLANGLAIHYGNEKSVYVVNLFKGTREAIRQNARYQEMSAAREEKIAALKGKIRHAGGGLHVLVIGESAVRDHMSAYGYARPTTPWLDSAAKQDNVAVLRQPYACYATTLQSLNYALTAKNQYNDVDLTEAISLGQIAQAAGYRTVWLSNQARYNLLSTPVGCVAAEADLKVYLHDSRDVDRSEVMDERLVERAKTLPLDGDTLLFVHLMGSHFHYKNQYPPTKAAFKGQNELIDHYDNTIRYTDEVLAGLFAVVSKRDNFRSFTYFSDHGEGVDEGLTHDAGDFRFSMVRIPLATYLAPEYCQKRPDFVKVLRQNSGKPWTNDLLFEYMYDLLAIKGFDGVDDTKNIASPKYNLTWDNAVTMYGQKRIADDPAAPKQK